MPGFLVGNLTVCSDLINRYPERCVQNSIITENGFFQRNTLNKFMLDKAFCETQYAVLVAEGYLLNKQELFAEYGVSDMAELMWTMYQKKGETFFVDFRGCFSGVLFDKAANKWLVYTNHQGDNPVFYAIQKNVFFAGSQVNYIIDSCRKNAIELTFDEGAAYQMMTYAFMADDSTYAQEIKRLRGGTYLCIEDGEPKVKVYHTFSVQNRDKFEGLDENALIDVLDQSFRKAVELEYRKDEEYGYQHLADISGGLDSRMNVWVAHTLKDRHLQLMAYSKAGYLDETIAKQIACFWKDDLLFKPLDDASFIYDIDENTFLNGGLSLYVGITGGKRMLEALKMESVGLEHTGMLGDIVIGSWYRRKGDVGKKLPTGRYSEKLAHRVSGNGKSSMHSFDDYEVDLTYTRGFQGAANTHLIRKNYTEVVSPFMYVDFMQLCLDISAEIRAEHNLYKKWILLKYPKAALFRWEKTGGKITESIIKGKIRHVLVHGPNKIKRLLGWDKSISSGMNPLDYWVAHNKSLQKYLDEYARSFFANPIIKMSDELIIDMKKLYEVGTINEKCMVLTVMSAIKLYFGEYRNESAF